MPRIKAPRKPLVGFSKHPAERKTASVFPSLDQGLATAARYTLVVLGMWTLLSFFFYIDYFPAFDLVTASGLLISLAFVTVPITLGLSSCFLMPYLFVGLFLWERRTQPDGPGLNRALLGWVAYVTLGFFAANLIVVVYSVMHWTMEWALLAYLSVLLLLLVLGYKTARARHLKKYAARYAGRTPERLERLWRRRPVRKLWTARMGAAIGVGLSQAIPVTIVLLVLSQASDLTEDDLWRLAQALWLVTMITALSSVWILKSILGRPARSNWMPAAVILFLLPSVLGFFMDARGLLPMTVAQATKMGNFRATRLILSKDACHALAPALQLQCAQIDHPIELCNAHVMSRPGSEIYLKVPGQIPPGAAAPRPVLSLLIPSATVLAMEIDHGAKFLRLNAIDDDLRTREPVCQKP